MEELKSRILSLNLEKNNYASKKIKGEISESDNKNLISSLIYVIADCRRVASDIGISDDGKINREEPSISIFVHLNKSVNELKKQILTLTNATQQELKEIMKEQSDHRHIENNKKEKKGKDEKSRQNEMRDRLRENLLSKNKEESSSN